MELCMDFETCLTFENKSFKLQIQALFQNFYVSKISGYTVAIIIPGKSN